jgi:hypothetical protein
MYCICDSVHTEPAKQLVKKQHCTNTMVLVTHLDVENLLVFHCQLCVGYLL